MKNLILTYAFLKSLYDTNKNYIDSFCPFVLNALHNSEGSTVNQIQDFIKDNYKISIPLHTLSSILIRAKRKKYIAYENNENILTDVGRQYFDSLENERDVDRRINELLKDLKIHLKNKMLKDNEVLNLLLQFVNKNIEPLLCFCSNGLEINSVPNTAKETGYEDELIEYFRIVENDKPNIWETLKDIVFGSLISLAPNTIDITEEERKFNKLQIFIDSNFFFSIFDLNPREISKPISELFNLLKNNNFEIKIFDFTIDEIIRVLKVYIKSQYYFVEGVEVDSIYSILKNRNWTSQDVYIFIQNIYKNIENNGIKILATGIDLKNYIPKEEYLNNLKIYKPYTAYGNTTDLNYNHDLAAIEMIRKIRGENKWKIENSIAIFLTSDLKLSRFDFEIFLHQERQTVCEVIPDRLFTNILWLKDPNKLKDTPLHMVIAANSKDILINRSIWRRFTVNLQKLRNTGTINDLDMAMLFYNNHIQGVLLGMEESDIDSINEDFIVKESLNVREKINKETQEKIDKETQEKIDKEKKISDEKITEKDIEIKKFIDQFTNISELIKKNVLKESNRISLLIHYIIIVVIIIIVVLLSIFLKKYLIYIGLILAIFPLLDIKYNILQMRSKLNHKVFNKLFVKRMKEINLIP